MYLQTEPNNKDDGKCLVLFIFIAIFLVSCVICLSGCVTEKQRDRICRDCQHTDSVIITKHDTTIVRDTVLFISQVGDTIEIPCPEAKPYDIIKKLNGVKTEVISNGKKVECICSDDSLKFVIAKIRADHFAEIDSVKNETHLVDCEKPHHTGWDTFGNWCAMIDIIAFILVVLGLIYHLVVSRKI